MKTVKLNGCNREDYMKVASFTAGAVGALVLGLGAQAPALAANFDADDIGGEVRGPKGPEAGVWVIAETRDLATRFIKIVVTDDQGRYVLPDLPKAKYDVWVRGYGLADSKKIQASPGQTVNHAAINAPNAAAAAQHYPANYWYALIEPPAASEFPGTGPQGNGISPSMRTQQDWLAHQKEGCFFCHQLGTPATRELPESGNSVEAWAQRIAKARPPGDPTVGDSGQMIANLMGNLMTRFGRERGLKMYADWTDKIRNGALPPEAPPRPKGKERNVVLSMWDWGDSTFVHDVISTDRRNPSVNAGGRIYGVSQWTGEYLSLDPAAHKPDTMPMPGIYPPTPHDKLAEPHNPMMDQKGRVWATNQQRGIGDNTKVCAGTDNKYAKYFPVQGKRLVNRFDPDTKKMNVFPVCFSNHHLAFGYDKDNTLHFSGDATVMGWINTRILDETGDINKAQGWCPIVLDTNGDGKITPDRNAWNKPASPAVAGGEGSGGGQSAAPAASFDPAKDTQLSGFLYGANVNPADGSVWYVKYSPYLPSGIIRFVPGASAPETCLTEYYELPKGADGLYPAYAARGIDLDSNGVAWVSYASGHIASFDRRKCKVLKGPTATGQQCPEGWTLHKVPGPNIADGKTSADMIYLTWVDLHDAFGLGKNVPYAPGTNSDSMFAYLPGSGEMLQMRVPYPTGFYARGLDGRIDDPKAGWKGRGLWSNFGTVTVFHHEDGEGDTSKVVHFQMRPDPLAH